MQIPVLIEPVARNDYRAKVSQPFAVSARGATREEALAKLRAKIESRLKNGTQIVGLEVGAAPAPPKHPWMEFAGMFKDDPMLEEWKQAMAEYRRKIEEDPDQL